MASIGSQVVKIAKQVRSAARQRSLEQGESGWGAPHVPPPVLVESVSGPQRVVIIGAGVQGTMLAQGARRITGVEVSGLVDRDEARAHQGADSIGLDRACCSTDAAEALGSGRVDLAVIATTSGSHVPLGRLALNSGAIRILLEKPIGTSYEEASEFAHDCAAAGVPLAINYSRRWLPDHRAIVRAVQEGQIGPVRIITVQAGAGELAMHGSHFVDFCRMVLGTDPVEVAARLRPRSVVNQRGAEFDDPTGTLTLRFSDSARAFIDFEDDLPPRDVVITIRGDDGMIMVEEHQQVWTLRSRSSRTWTFPFAEPFRPLPVASRTLFGVLSEDSSACSAVDGLHALDVILGAHHSQQTGGGPIALPLTASQRTMALTFP